MASSPPASESRSVSPAEPLHFVAPDGTRFVARLGAGSSFEAAIVEVAAVRGGEAEVAVDADPPVRLVCKRPRLVHLLRSRGERGEQGDADERSEVEDAARPSRSSLVREARALALLSAPHEGEVGDPSPALRVPRVVRVGNDAAGPFVLETEVVGVPLDRVRAHYEARGFTSPPASLVRHVATRALALLAEVRASADASRARLGLEGPACFSHGDLNLAHLVLEPHGDLALIDFGSARDASTPANLETDDRGTLPFAPPEVARGEAKPSDATDVYALAASLVAFATEAPLTRASERAAMLVEVGERGIDPAAIERCPAFDAQERAALARALDADPAARSADLAALAQAFARGAGASDHAS